MCAGAVLCCVVLCCVVLCCVVLCCVVLCCVVLCCVVLCCVVLCVCVFWVWACAFACVRTCMRECMHACVRACAGAVLLNSVTHGKNRICPSILIHPSCLCIANVKAQVLKSMVAQHIHVCFSV